MKAPKLPTRAVLSTVDKHFQAETMHVNGQPTWQGAWLTPCTLLSKIALHSCCPPVLVVLQLLSPRKPGLEAVPKEQQLRADASRSTTGQTKIRDTARAGQNGTENKPTETERDRGTAISYQPV